MEKKLYELKIDPELEQFFPPLPIEILNGLTNSIIKDGCIEPIVVWNGTILDGHNRYHICWENNIPFEYIKKDFANKDEALLWMFQKQSNRRSLPAFQRCELVYHLKAAILEEVEQGRREAISKYQRTGIHGSPSLRTAERLAKYAGVSPSMWKRANFIIENADEAIKEQIRAEELSVRKAYDMLKASINNQEAQETDTGINENLETCSEDEINDDLNIEKSEELEAVDEIDEADEVEVDEVGEADSPNKSDDWLPRACSTDGEKAEEPPIEYIAGFKPVTHQEPMEYFPHEPERNPGPFYYVKDYTRSALKNMVKEIKAAVYQLSDEDVDKCGEIFSMLEQAYNEARTIIEGEIKFHSSHKN